VVIGLTTHAIGSSATGVTVATDSPSPSDATPNVSISPTPAVSQAAYPCPQSSTAPTPGSYPFHANNAICFPNVPQSLTDRINGDLTLQSATDARVQVSEAEAQAIADPVAAKGWSGYADLLKLQAHALVTVGPNGPLEWIFVYYSPTKIQPLGCEAGLDCGGHYFFYAVDAVTGKTDLMLDGLASES